MISFVWFHNKSFSIFLCLKTTSLKQIFRKNPNLVTVAMSIKTFWLQANFTNLFVRKRLFFYLSYESLKSTGRSVTTSVRKRKYSQSLESSVDRNRKWCVEYKKCIQGGQIEDGVGPSKVESQDYIIKGILEGIRHNLGLRTT